MSMTPLEKIRKAYVSFGLLCFNAALLLAILNGLFAGFYSVLDARRQKLENSLENFQAIYPGRTMEQILQIKKETYGQGYLFEPYTMFRDRPRQGQYVTVDRNGFRLSEGQGPWPPQASNYNVFLFGGSTAFGWYLADQETIASYLQPELGSIGNKPVRVYNFGRTYYIIAQERILFEQLLVAGIRPDAAVFLDGLNEVYQLDGLPTFSPAFASLVEGRMPSVIVQWPVVRAAQSLRAILLASGSWFSSRGKSDSGPAPESLAAQDHSQIDSMIARYLANKSLVESLAAANGIRLIFVWQPVPVYKYNLKYYPFGKEVAWRLVNYREAYPRMDEQRQQADWAADFVWCADIQEGRNEPLYVDPVHYTARMSRLVAQCIAQNARQRNLLASIPRRDLRTSQMPTPSARENPRSSVRVRRN